MIAMTLGRDQPEGESKRENTCRNQINHRDRTKLKARISKKQQEKKQSMFGAKHESDCDELMHSSRQINEAYALHKPPHSPPNAPPHLGGG